jgi:hypothetical protein
LNRSVHGFQHLSATTIVLAVCQLTFISVALAEPPDDSTPEARAIRFLAREVPRWPRDNACFSCHHNGDAPRALIRAGQLGFEVPRNALTSTLNWISHPEGWDRNGGQGPFNDKRLARIVFSTTLRAASEASVHVDRSSLVRAAEILASDQAKDGSWRIEGDDGNIGSPASYGRPLATLMARDTLRAIDPTRFRQAVEKADSWLLGLDPKGVFDAAVALWASSTVSPIEKEQFSQIARIRVKALDLIRRGQDIDGGWGPFASSPPEVFDTAIVLLALKASHTPGREIEKMAQRGRAYLVAQQAEDGSWPETTRPPGAQSDAQHLSTTSWALLALLATSDSR